MKVVILAGGLPSTLIEDARIPKPMAEIGGQPILWHIMKYYSSYGYSDFLICTGYKGEVIKDYFMNYYVYQSDITVNLQTNEVVIHRKQTEDWNVSVIDTGINTTVTKRIKMIEDYLEEEPFIVVYGDCIANINIEDMLNEHKKSGKIATYAVGRPTGRSELLPVDKDKRFDIQSFDVDKAEAWSDAGCMAFNFEIFKYLDNDENILSMSTLNQLIDKNQVNPYFHKGFWMPVETVRDKSNLDTLWEKNIAPWKIW